ncbi:uncharacterized protein LOC130407433 isoform X2 [Triplophysa dalaica]|uniref:uncharacterized protein LOC130407433 isoform X2 n=1 Tax=Triplophysa dalaica TaxID=1582913 RepID=UPI0024DF3791|nr:uncharacterized protein LOC130407433 isoform X2 [Triplophysa dalaica]
MKDSEWDTEMPECNTPTQFLKVKRKHTYSRLNKTTAWLNDKKRNTQNSNFHAFFINAAEEPEKNSENKKMLPIEDSEPSQGSLDSSSTTTSFNTGSSVEDESPCSVCEDQKGNEDGSPPSSGTLLRDPMLGAFPAAWKKRVSIRPMPPETPTLPRHPLVRKADTLILSPSLLTLPSQGLNHPFLPEDRETLQTLFEDVWVTPESNTLKTLRLPCRIATESSAGSGCQYSESKEGNKASTPEQFVPLKKERKAHARRRTEGRGRVEIQVPSSKKKCVNGFIMFCRMNRKVYLRSHPGTPSTTVTKELANLWHVMPKQEKRLYCLKAWKFSCQNNRNVRVSVQEQKWR